MYCAPARVVCLRVYCMYVCVCIVCVWSFSVSARHCSSRARRRVLGGRPHKMETFANRG